MNLSVAESVYERERMNSSAEIERGNCRVGRFAAVEEGERIPHSVRTKRGANSKEVFSSD